MANRISWDEQEAAILIDACARYNNGDVTKQEAVVSVSGILRQRAINKGIVIDDVFRNKNGITMQLMLMNELMTEEKCGLRGASKLFINMVEMFKNDRLSFDRILKEAKQVGVENPVKNEFFKWIANKVSANQLSDSYIMCHQIEKYCLNRGILEAGLFETTDVDTVNKVSRIIACDKEFREEHRRSLSKISGVINYYIHFLKEFSVDGIATISRYDLTPVAKGMIDGKKIEVDDTDDIENLSVETLEHSREQDFENIIKSSTKVNEKNDTNFENTSHTEVIDGVAEKRKQFSAWLNSKGEDTGVILVSLMDLSKMGKMALRKGIIDKDIYFIDSPSTLKTVSGRLQRCDEFLGLLSRLQRQYIMTLDSYIEYKTKDNNHTKNNEITSQLTEFECNELANDKFTVSEDAEQLEAVDGNSDYSDGEEKLALILKEDYENGFKVKSPIDKGKFKLFYKERFNEELLISDEQLIQSLMRLGSLREERIFPRQDDEQKELLQQIYDEVVAVFNSGVSCVYENSIYDRYGIELVDKLQIYDSGDIGDLLLEMSQGKLRRNHTFLCLNDGQSELKQDVLDVLKESSMPLNYDEIEEIMWYVPIDKIKQVMVNIKSIVYVASETYFYAPNLPVSQEELMDIKRLICKALDTKSHMTDVELRATIEENCPSVAINTADFTTYGLRNSLAYILRDAFAFNGPIISLNGIELGMAEIFVEYCRDRVQVTTEELKTLALDMGTVIYWDAIRDVTVRISDEILLRDDQLNFDIESIDILLDELCDKDYIPLKDIGLFIHFPSLPVPWNGYVLESFLYKYSKKFKLLHAGFSASGYFGAMVRKECTIDDYRKMIVDALAHSKKWIDESSALEFLVREGYQQRRLYADIENVILEAKLFKEKIKDTMK